MGFCFLCFSSARKTGSSMLQQYAPTPSAWALTACFLVGEATSRTCCGDEPHARAVLYPPHIHARAAIPTAHLSGNCILTGHHHFPPTTHARFRQADAAHKLVSKLNPGLGNKYEKAKMMRDIQGAQNVTTVTGIALADSCVYVSTVVTLGYFVDGRGGWLVSGLRKSVLGMHDQMPRVCG